MEEFVSDVKDGKHRGKWCNTFYSTTKVGEVALTKVYARDLAKTGIYMYISTSVFMKYLILSFGDGVYRIKRCEYHV
jgi:hypothetical protein